MLKTFTAAIAAAAIFATAPAQAANIVETAQKTGKFNTLLAAAKAAGLAGALAKGKNLTAFSDGCGIQQAAKGHRRVAVEA